MGEIGSMYAEGRSRITELVSGLDPATASTKVPTCPEWSVQDVVAHVVGICDDIIGGRLEGVASDPWTAAQVDARRGRTMTELIDEWEKTAPQVEAMVDQFGSAGNQLVFDLTTHEHDIRGALGQPGGRDSARIALGLDFVVEGAFGPSLSERGLGPVEVRVEGRSWLAGGEGEPVATLTAPGFELFRAFTGRRSVAQIAGLDWSVDPAPYIPAFTAGPFRPSPADLHE